MRSFEGYVVPALATLLLHAVMLVMLTINWHPDSDRIVRPMPRHVMARVVTLDKATVKKPETSKPRVEQPKPKPEALDGLRAKREHVMIGRVVISLLIPLRGAR